jgi:ATP-binding cassette subfamily C protein
VKDYPEDFPDALDPAAPLPKLGGVTRNPVPRQSPAAPRPDARTPPPDTPILELRPEWRIGEAVHAEILELQPDWRIDTPAARAKTDKAAETTARARGPAPPAAPSNRPPGRGPETPKAPPAGGRGGGDSGGKPPGFHARITPENFAQSLSNGLAAVRRNMLVVLLFTAATNILILAIPIYLFQISDRVLTSRSTDTLIMLTVVIVGAVILQTVFDALRRFVLMRTAVEMAVQLGASILSAAARAALHSNGREYQTLGDLQQLRSFLVSGTLLSFLDVPFVAPFILAIFFIHPHLGWFVVVTAAALFVIAFINQKLTSKRFAEANAYQSKANLHLDSMTRNSQIINALAMIPEAVKIWGCDTAGSLRAQVKAQDRNIVWATVSRAIRLLTQVGMLGWGAHLALDGQITGGMVIAASIIAGRALAPIEGAIEGWNAFLLSQSAYGRIVSLLHGSPLGVERLRLPNPEGRVDVERLLYVPDGTRSVVLNGISFRLDPGESLAVIGNSGAGKTTLGKMLVGAIMPTSGAVRLDLMDLRNWDPRQLGENIGYLPQDVQLFPGSIKRNIARMRDDATDADIYEAARLADVHDLIANFPQGYETLVAADGAPLSGGQKQRIALARAFFGGPRLVVLDEPNANLDAAGDLALGRAMEHARANRITVVVVTQKPSLLKHVDKVMLLSEGTIAEFGPRDAVMKRLESRQVRAAPQTPPPNRIDPPQGA